MPRSHAFLSRRPSSVHVPAGAFHRRPVPVCKLLHRRTPLFRVLGPHQFRVRALLDAPCRGQQVDEEGEDVKGEDEGDDPLEDGGDVLVYAERGGGEDDGEGGLDEDEGELEPEGEAQDAVLAEVDAQALVLGADEDGADDVAAHEEEEESAVQILVVDGVEDG